VEHRHQPAARTATRSVKQKVGKSSPATALSLPHIAQLIESGDITIGLLRSVGCVATADEDCTYAMLVRRRRESLFRLLARLDQAIEKALTDGICTANLETDLLPASPLVSSTVDWIQLSRHVVPKSRVAIATQAVHRDWWRKPGSALAIAYPIPGLCKCRRCMKWRRTQRIAAEESC
jgi:hypothetical protein